MGDEGKEPPAAPSGWLDRLDLHSLADIMGVGAAVISRDYQTLEANEYLRSVFGDVVGKRCYRAYSGRSDVCPGCAVRRVFEEGCERARSEQRGEDSQGREVWSQITAVPLHGEGGELLAALELLVPLTERVQAEGTLRHRLRYEEMLGEIASLAFQVEDIAAFQQSTLALVGTVMDVSRTYIFEHHQDTDTMDNTFEWAAEGVAPQRETLQGVPAEDTPWWMEQMRAGEVIRFRSIEDIPGAAERDILRTQDIHSILAVPLFVNQQYYGFLGLDECRRQREWMPEDVHILRALAHMLAGVIAQGRSRQALRESEARFRRLSDEFHGLLDAIPDTIAHLSSQYDILWANRWAAEGLGMELDSLLGKKCYRIWHQRETPCEVCPATEAMASGEMRSGIVTTPGGVEWEVRSVPIAQEDASAVSVVEVARDISVRRRAEEEREHLIRVLEEKSREVEQFAYTVSHDLKTPLTTIRGFLQLLQRERPAGDPAPTADYMESMGQAADRMQQMLDELLALTRAGSLDMQMQSVDMVSLAREAVAVASGLLRERSVTVEIAPDLPPAWGDRQRLRQVLENLVSNAARFMGNQSGPRVEIGARPQAPGEPPAYYVRDNGVGIGPEDQHRIFQLFEKVDSQGSGTGFGLAIVRRIVERHGGTVWVESAGPGSGSTFCFTLAAEPLVVEPSPPM